jgi:hypothetical protein
MLLYRSEISSWWSKKPRILIFKLVRSIGLLPWWYRSEISCWTIELILIFENRKLFLRIINNAIQSKIQKKFEIFLLCKWKFKLNKKKISIFYKKICEFKKFTLKKIFSVMEISTSSIFFLWKENQYFLLGKNIFHFPYLYSHMRPIQHLRATWGHLGGSWFSSHSPFWWLWLAPNNRNFTYHISNYNTVHVHKVNLPHESRKT